MLQAVLDLPDIDERDLSSLRMITYGTAPMSVPLLRRALENESWRVSEAENGRVALEQVAREVPSLILLDLMMPVMDGFDFVLEMRKVEAWRSIPIVVVTSKDITEEDRRRLNGGVANLIQREGLDRKSLLAQLREQVEAVGRDGS